MNSTVERLAVEAAPRRKAKASTEVWQAPVTDTRSDIDLRDLTVAVADLQNKAASAEDVLAISTSLAGLKAEFEALKGEKNKHGEHNALTTEALELMAQRIDRIDAIASHLAARPVSPSRIPEIVMGNLRAVAMVLAARFLIVLALAGTFVLALMAMQNQTPTGVYLTVAFALLTLAPLVYMESRQRPPVPSVP